MPASKRPPSTPPGVRLTLPQLLQALYEERRTGPVTFHFHEGKPLAVEILGPAVKVQLDTRRRT